MKLLSLLPGLLLLASSLHPVQGFIDGDFVQTARKSQFHAQRTQWHDLLGQHCPRFGHDRLKPLAPLGDQEEYKLQLSFDGDRHVTPWLTIMGKSAPAVPVVEVLLRRAGDELLGVSARVRAAPVSYQHAHPHAVAEFRNATHWPKHLLVRYSWDTHNDVDLDRGLYVLFGAALLVFAVLAINAVRGAGPKLTQFLAEVTGEAADGGASTSWVKSGGAKAE